MRGWETEAKMSENFVSQWNYFKENTNLTSGKATCKAKHLDGMSVTFDYWDKIFSSKVSLALHKKKFHN